MEKRSLFKMIFGNKTEQTTVEKTQLRLLNSYTPTFYDFGNEAYDSDVVRSAIDAIARNAAKLKPKHIRRINNEILTSSNSNIEKQLQLRPNFYMDAYSFYYKVVTQLYMKNNAFIYVDMDKSGNYNGFYPIISTNVELLENNGVLLVRFHFMNGERITLEYTKIIHLRRFYYKHDIYGEPNDTALNPTLELINTSNQGIINAVKSSAFLRGILKFSQSMLKDEDIKAQRDKFVTEYLSLDNNGGIGALDSKADFIPLKSEPVTVDEKQLQHIKQSVYNYFGVNEKIINSTYSEDEWNAFYESVLEPISLQMSLEFTIKIFTERDKGHGNEIIFEANRLQYASNTTKINLIKETLPFGLLTINEAREILNLAPVDGGDKRLQSLNFVDSNVANDYQLGKKVEEENDGE